MKVKMLLTTVVLFALTLGQASAVQYTFSNITNNNAGDAAIGEAQLFVDVTAVGANQVQFLFSNIGPAASSITDIYFDDDAPLLVFASFQSPTTGVAYSAGASPGNLPGGAPYNFSSNYDFDSDPPTQPNGVNPNESLGLVFNLNSVSFQDVLDALDNTSMRIGIHVQGFASGGSESFINDPGTPIPEPATMVLFGIGVVGVAVSGRKSRGNR